MLYHLHQHDVEKVSVLDDVDFCIELMESDRINVAYIMNLIRNVSDDPNKRKKDIEHIRDELKRADNQQLHRKIDLIQAFLDKLENGIEGDIDIAYEEFENAEKKKDIQEFAKKENIDEKVLTEEVSEYEFSGILNEGDIRDNIQAPMSLLKKRSLVRRIVDFIVSHVAKYQ